MRLIMETFREQADGRPKKALSATQVLKTLNQAAKKARAFECQKLIRKLKNLKAEEEDHATEVRDLEVQLEAVKNVDASLAASSSLISYCSKHELSQALPEDLLQANNSSAKPDGATTQGKALNRILANKHMHESVTTTAAKLDPNSTADQSSEPVAGPSKSKADKTQDKDKQQKKKEKEKAAAQPAKSAPAGSSTFLPSLSAGFTMGDSDNEDDFSLSEGEDEDPALPQRKNRRGQRARRAIWEKKYGRGAKHLQKSAEAEQLAKAAVDAKKASRTSKAKQRADAFSREYEGKHLHQQQQHKQQEGGPRHHEPRESHQQQRQAGSRPFEGDSRGQKRGRPTEEGEDEASLHPSWKARKMASEKASLGVAGGGFSGTKITFD